MSHDDQGQAGAERWFPLWCTGGKPQARSPEEPAKGFHSGATRPRPPGRQDGGHHRAHRSVTTRGFSQVKTTFVRISCTTCPLSKRPLWDPFSPTFGKRTKATINRTSHHHTGKTSRTSTHHTNSLELNNTSPPEASSSTILVHPQPSEAIHQNAGVGYYAARWPEPR